MAGFGTEHTNYSQKAHSNWKRTTLHYIILTWPSVHGKYFNKVVCASSEFKIGVKKPAENREPWSCYLCPWLLTVGPFRCQVCYLLKVANEMLGTGIHRNVDHIHHTNQKKPCLHSLHRMLITCYQCVTWGRWTALSPWGHAEGWKQPGHYVCYPLEPRLHGHVADNDFNQSSHIPSEKTW